MYKSLLMLLGLLCVISCTSAKARSIRFTITSSNATLQEGDNVTLSCSGIAQVQLQYNNLAYDGNTVAVHTFVASPSDQGQIAVCLDYSTNSTKSIKLEVYYKPTLKDGVVYTVPLGQESSVVLSYATNPPPILQTIFNANGSSITNYYTTADGDRHTIVLHFLKVKQSDLGNYTLWMNTTTGRFKYTFILKSALSEYSSNLFMLIVYTVPAVSLAVCIIVIIVSVCCVTRKNKAKLNTKAIETKTNDYVKHGKRQVDEHKTPSQSYKPANAPAAQEDRPPPVTQRTTSLHPNNIGSTNRNASRPFSVDSMDSWDIDGNEDYESFQADIVVPPRPSYPQRGNHMSNIPMGSCEPREQRNPGIARGRDNRLPSYQNEVSLPMQQFPNPTDEQLYEDL